MIKINYNTWLEVFQAYEHCKEHSTDKSEGTLSFAVWLERTFEPEKEYKMTLEEFRNIINNPNPKDACDIHLKHLWVNQEYQRIFEITGLSIDFNMGRPLPTFSFGEHYLRLKTLQYKIEETRNAILGVTQEEHDKMHAEVINNNRVCDCDDNDYCEAALATIGCQKCPQRKDKKPDVNWQEELVKCKEDPTYFFEKYWKVIEKPRNIGPTQGYVLPGTDIRSANKPYCNASRKVKMSCNLNCKYCGYYDSDYDFGGTTIRITGLYKKSILRKNYGKDQSTFYIFVSKKIPVGSKIRIYACKHVLCVNDYARMDNNSYRLGLRIVTSNAHDYVPAKLLKIDTKVILV